MIKCVAENGGEISFKTVEGEVQDVHIAPDKSEVIAKPPEVLTSRLRSRQGSAKLGDTDCPEQSGLNICGACGCKLVWDVLDVCLVCVAGRSAA